jgi:hypothetical protein
VTRRGGSVLGLVVSVMLLGGCFLGSSDGPSPDYDPVDDATLIEQVEQLPGVRSVDIDFSSSFTNGPVYSGYVRVDRSADLLGTLDATAAVLWQGKPRAIQIVKVQGPQGSVENSTVRLQSTTDLEERFGPQPGTGEVPADAAPLPRPPSLK